MTSHDQPTAAGLETALELKLQERLLLARPAPGDRLLLDDATLSAALDGSRALTPNERRALAASPLTLRRLRHLSLQRHASAQDTAQLQPLQASRPSAANDADWHGSSGMLRAAATNTTLETLATDDQYWTLHFIGEDGLWQVILALSAQAPFAAQLLRQRPLLRVFDGAGAIVLEGRLDADGECESRWPFALAPAPHFQQHGASFSVQPVAP